MTYCPTGGSSHIYFISHVPPSKGFWFILSNKSIAPLLSQYSHIACLHISFVRGDQDGGVYVEMTTWGRGKGKGEGNREQTYEALLQALNDFTSPNESHILPASAMLMLTCGLRIIRIDPWSLAPSLVLCLCGCFSRRRCSSH